MRARICDVDARRRNAAKRAILHGTTFIREVFAERGATCKSAATVAALIPLTSSPLGGPATWPRYTITKNKNPLNDERASGEDVKRATGLCPCVSGRERRRRREQQRPSSPPSSYSSREQKHLDPPPLHESAAVARTDSLIVFRRWYYEARPLLCCDTDTTMERRGKVSTVTMPLPLPLPHPLLLLQSLPLRLAAAVGRKLFLAST